MKHRTMSKSKYLFADRQTAETECRRQGHLASKYRRMLTAIIAGEAKDIRGSYYDAYFLADECDRLAMIVYHGSDLQQKPVVSVYADDEIKDWHRSLVTSGKALPSSEDAEGRHLCQLLQDVLIAMHDYRR